MAAVSGDLRLASEMMDNISDFVEKVYGKNGEIEIFMSGILVDGDIVKAAIASRNQRFGVYLDNVTTAETNIKKKLKKTAKQ